MVLAGLHLLPSSSSSLFWKFDVLRWTEFLNFNANLSIFPLIANVFFYHHYREIFHDRRSDGYSLLSSTKRWKDFFFFKTLFIYFLREQGRKGEREGRETSMCGCLSHAPYWGPGPKPRHVPWLGIEPVTLWFTGWHSIHRATPARAKWCFFKNGKSHC